MKPIRNILVATDFSSASRPVLEEEASGVDRRGHGEHAGAAKQGDGEGPGGKQRRERAAGRAPREVVLRLARIANSRSS
ncbi:MAG: hypothetical protein WEF99_06665 [Thermoanaerobaculia bacterium]